MDASSENAKKKIVTLLRQICFRKKKINESPHPGYFKRQGDDTYALAVIYAKQNLFARAEKAGLASVGYYQKALLREETTDALWDLSWSWIMLRNLYRGQSDPAYREKALHAAMQCVRLFLRLTRLSNDRSYFANYQASCEIAAKIMLKMGGDYARKADDLCRECLNELKRWPDPEANPFSFCRMGSVWFLRVVVYDALQKDPAFNKAELKKKRFHAIKQGTRLYQRALDTDPRNLDVASYVVCDYDDYQRDEELSPKLRSYYAQKEFECYEQLFLRKPKENARYFFCSAMLYCKRSAKLISPGEKRGIFKKMERHLKHVDFCAAHDTETPYYLLKAVYYLAEICSICLPGHGDKRESILTRCCLLGVPVLASGHYDHDTGGFFLLALDALLEADSMASSCREAFAGKMQKVLNVIEEEDSVYKPEAERLERQLKEFNDGCDDWLSSFFHDLFEEED